MTPPRTSLVCVSPSIPSRHLASHRPPLPPPTAPVSAEQTAVPPRDQVAAPPLWQAIKLAAHTVVVVTRNASISITVAWVVAFLFSKGNIFLAQPQSHTVFLTATLLWGDFFFTWGMLIARSSALFHHQLQCRPGRPMGIVRCLAKMFANTWWMQLLVGSIVFAIGLISAKYTPTRARSFRLELYLSIAANHPYTTWVDAVARKIYRNETVQGQLQQQQQKRRRRTDAPAATTDVSAHIHTSAMRNRVTPAAPAAAATTRPKTTSKWRRVWDASTHNIPLLLCILTPTLYVHVVSQNLVSATSQLVWFSVACVFAKVAMQELAKIYILHKKTANLRSMAVIVVVPTVMVDTQMRLILVSQQSSAGTLSSLFVLALVEISVRIGKLVVISMEIKLKQRRLRIQLENNVDLREMRRLHAEFTEWRSRVHQYHITEVAADMYAEYLAIGCSYAILFFFAEHPNFALDLHAYQSTTSSSSSSLNSLTQILFAKSQVVGLFVQVGVEMLVDCVACTLEIHKGQLDFGSFERDRVFYILFFAIIAMLNIFVSSVLYLRAS